MAHITLIPVSESLQVGSQHCLLGHLVDQQPRKQSLKCGEVSISSFFFVCLAACCFVGPLCLYIYSAILEPHVWKKTFSQFISSISRPTAKAKPLKCYKALTPLDQLRVPYLRTSANWWTLSKVIDDLFALGSALIETASNLESFHYATPEHVPLRDPSFQFLHLAEPLYGRFCSENF